ncbi:MAG: hypothetical protein KGO96_06820 [Elusimicrobia bacterium]|nr:hypothetical protein [Elusimicrobiota bacterium]
MLTENSKELIKQYQLGDKKSLDLLLDENKKLIYKLVHIYGKALGSTYKDDLMQEGFIGFIKAVKAVDTSRSVQAIRFYVAGYIRKRILAYSAQNLNIVKHYVELLGKNKQRIVLKNRNDAYFVSSKENPNNFRAIEIENFLEQDPTTNPESLVSKKEIINRLHLVKKIVSQKSDTIDKEIIKEMLGNENRAGEKVGKKFGLTRHAICVRKKKIEDKIINYFKEV